MDTLDNGTFLERSEQLGAFFAHAGFHDSAAGNHHVVALAVKLDHLEFEGLAFERGGVLDRTGVDERTRQEGTDAVGHDGEAALDLAGDGTGDEFAGFQSLFEVHPGSQALGLVAGKNRFAETVFGRFDCHGNEVAGLNGHFTEVVLEFFDGHIGFGLQAGVHNHEVVFDAQHFGGDNFTLTQEKTSLSSSRGAAQHALYSRPWSFRLKSARHHAMAMPPAMPSAARKVCSPKCSAAGRSLETTAFMQ